MIKSYFHDGRVHEGLSYPEFLENSRIKLDSSKPELLDEGKKKLFEYTKLNYQRSIRIKKTYKVSQKLEEQILKINTPQIWMVLTEDWCGDSAQNLPYIAKFAELNKKIKMKILLRDENLNIMDLYLTDGTSRSIPKLISLNSEGEELFIWGPRPKIIQNMVKNWQQEGKTKVIWQQELHSIYAKNKGKLLEDDFIELLSRKN